MIIKPDEAEWNIQDIISVDQVSDFENGNEVLEISIWLWWKVTFFCLFIDSRACSCRSLIEVFSCSASNLLLWWAGRDFQQFCWLDHNHALWEGDWCQHCNPYLPIQMLVLIYSPLNLNAITSCYIHTFCSLTQNLKILKLVYELFFYSYIYFVDVMYSKYFFLKGKFSN